MESKNILITGGAGFIGSNLADKLSEKNNVIIIDNLSTGLKENINDKCVFYNLDIRSDLEFVFSNHHIDYVFHTAAFINLRKSFEFPVECMDINLNGTINLINYCKKYNTKNFIFSSTAGAIYDPMSVFPWTEISRENPKSPYGMSKLFAEKYIKNSGINYVNLRYANVYGPKQNAHGEAGVISIFLDNAKNNNKIKVFGNGFQTRDFVHVYDVVKANILATKTSNKTYNVSTNKETSLIEIIELLKNKYDLDVDYLPANKDELMYCKISYDSIDNDLDWYPEYKIKDYIIL